MKIKMKKYKHIPTGKIFKQPTNNDDYVSEDGSTYHKIPAFLIGGKDWEEIKEKEWEILSFKSKSNNVFKLDPTNNDYTKGGYFGYMSLEACHSVMTIYSVKRLLDGKVFTIGDNIKSIDWDSNSDELVEIFIPTKTEAKGFTFNVGDLVLKTKHTWQTTIQNAVKMENPALFTTEDGINVYSGDTFYLIPIDSPREIRMYVAVSNVKYACSMLAFSTEEAAEDFILEHQKCLSIQDVIEHIPFTALNNLKLTKLVRQRTQIKKYYYGL